MKRESSDTPSIHSEILPPKDGLIVFDFDGTITTKDTFALFLRYYAGFWVWLRNILSLLPVFISYKLGRINRHSVKAAVIHKFFAGESISNVDRRAKSFAQDVIPKLIRPEALICFKLKMADIERVYICSASISPYLLHWADSLDFPRKNVLSVELAADLGVLTGEIEGYNVWGKNKVRRVFDVFCSGTVHIAEAYGDSEGDRELLNAAKASFFRPFRV